MSFKYFLRILNWLLNMRVSGFMSSVYWWSICLSCDVNIDEPFLRFSWVFFCDSTFDASFFKKFRRSLLNEKRLTGSFKADARIIVVRMARNEYLFVYSCVFVSVSFSSSLDSCSLSIYRQQIIFHFDGKSSLVDHSFYGATSGSSRDFIINKSLLFFSLNI